MGLAPQLDPRIAVASIRAPHRYGPGYAWFNVDWTEDGIVADERQAAESRDRLIEFLPEVASEMGVAPGRIVLGGFSQGAMMTLAVVLTRPDLVCGAMILSGRNIDSLAPNPPGDQVRSIPFLVQHGEEDDVLPVEDGREVRDRLARIGAPLAYREYPMGHEVSWASLRDAESWLRQLLF